MGWLWAFFPTRLKNFLGISIPLWDDCEFQKRIYRDPQNLFQFHYGMIVSSGKALATDKPYYFNSTMGWLWAIKPKPTIYITEISIPLWDDCESSINRVKENLYAISIPLWDDCEFTGLLEWLPEQVFQFHYGMIVRGIETKKQTALLQFQFHYGMIVRK